MAVNFDQRRPDADRFLAKLHPTFNVRESGREHLLAVGFIAMASPCEENSPMQRFTLNAGAFRKGQSCDGPSQKIQGKNGIS